MNDGSKNKGNLFLIIIIVLLVTLIEIGGVLVYRSYSDKDVNNNNVNENNKVEENTSVESDIEELSQKKCMIKVSLL